MILARMIGIAACDPRGVMGKEGRLPWHFPGDLQHFRETTLTSPLVMGHRTFLSLPAFYFEERLVIVFTRQKLAPRSNLISVSSFEEYLGLEGKLKELYVIGGAQIFSLFLKENLLDEFILTKMKGFYEGDTLFPLSLLADWSDLKVQEREGYNIHRLERVRANQYL